MPHTVSHSRLVHQSYVRIPRNDYLKLKKFQRQFGDIVQYIDHLRDIREAREDIKAGHTKPQEVLFKELGL